MYLSARRCIFDDKATTKENSFMSNEAQYKQLYPKGCKAAALAAGVAAPDFTLKTIPDQTVSLTDFRGQPVVLAFYPADWSPVCGDQMALYNEILPEFQSLGAE